jgi:hypothetical protein
MGMTWGGYTTIYTSLWTIPNRWQHIASWQALSRPVTLHRPLQSWTAFSGGGARGPRDGRSASVLTVRFPGGSELLWRTPPLPRWAWVTWLWWSCVFSWMSFHVRQWRDEFQHLSTCCQVRVGVCGYVLSCLALNDIVICGPRLSGHLLGRLGLQVAKSCLPTVIEMWERTVTDCSRV